MTALEWTLIVPARGAPHGKSRLAVPRREHLARAFALDTIEAALGALPASALLVVTNDDLLGPYAAAAGARVVPDPGAGLHGAIRAAGRLTVPGSALGVLLGDLPALRPEDLRAALRACQVHPRAFVPDRAGTGTVLLTVYGSVLESSFDPGSAARHQAAGFERLPLPLPRLRTDVDVRDDLEAVLALGCGRHTAAALAGAVPMGPGSEH